MPVETQNGILSMADNFAGLLFGEATTMEIWLNTSTAPITETSDTSDLVPPTYSGYAPQVFGYPTIAGTSFDTPNDRALVTNATLMTWTVSATGAPNYITGVAFVLKDLLTSLQKILVYVPISPYLVMQNAGDTFSFTPTVYFKHGD